MPHNGQPPVTVVIPTRNRPAMVKRAVAAVMGQSYPGDIEALVVYDQSDQEQLAMHGDERRRVRIATNSRTPGASGARNTGVLSAGHPFVAFCDDDDEWRPTKLEKQMAVLQQDPQVLVVGCGVRVFYQGRVFERPGPVGPVHFEHLLGNRHPELGPSTIVVRRNAMLDGIGLFDEEIPGSFSEDYEWLLRASRRMPIATVPEPLVDVHWHGTSWFQERWSVMGDALVYLLESFPEFQRNRKGRARVLGQISVARAAAGRRRDAARWARDTLRASPTEARAYMALAIATGMVKASTLMHLAHRMGKGI